MIKVTAEGNETIGEFLRRFRRKRLKDRLKQGIMEQEYYSTPSENRRSKKIEARKQMRRKMLGSKYRKRR